MVLRGLLDLDFWKVIEFECKHSILHVISPHIKERSGAVSSTSFGNLSV
jgi:hypothetical protein